jgi:hypothetical protein
MIYLVGVKYSNFKLPIKDRTRLQILSSIGVCKLKNQLYRTGYMCFLMTQYKKMYLIKDGRKMIAILRH